jgi:F420-dependent oxidoreductase-like protein
MLTGVVLKPDPHADNAVDDVVAQARRAYDAGVRQIWLSQPYDYDAIALAGLIGAAVPGLGVGTSAVPINPRHPLLMASLAQTAQAASHGNFSLGLALGAHALERRAFGTAWPNTVQRLREHLSVLRSIFNAGTVDFEGNEITAKPEWPVKLPGGTPVPVYVGAMAPKSLQVTAELAEGTLTFLAGPRTLAEFIEPTLAKAAAEAGRPKPSIIAAVPVLVSRDEDDARLQAAQELASHQTILSYQKVIARERVSHVADIAAVGPLKSVARQLRRYRDAGATDIVISPLRSEPGDLEAVFRLATEAA